MNSSPSNEMGLGGVGQIRHLVNWGRDAPAYQVGLDGTSRKNMERSDFKGTHEGRNQSLVHTEL